MDRDSFYKLAMHAFVDPTARPVLHDALLNCRRQGKRYAALLQRTSPTLTIVFFPTNYQRGIGPIFGTYVSVSASSVEFPIVPLATGQRSDAATMPDQCIAEKTTEQ